MTKAFLYVDKRISLGKHQSRKVFIWILCNVFIISLFENFSQSCVICGLNNSHHIFVVVKSKQLTFRNLILSNCLKKRVIQIVSLTGWLHKEVKNNPKMSSLKLKKRWFVLTHNSLDYYKSSEKNALKLGTLVLNSLCSVVPPDEKIFKETGNCLLLFKYAFTCLLSCLPSNAPNSA